MIVLIVHDELEKAAASLRNRVKKEFVFLICKKVVALVQIKTLARPRFVIETAPAQDMTRSYRCYTLEKLSHWGKNKDQTMRSICDAEAE